MRLLNCWQFYIVNIVNYTIRSHKTCVYTRVCKIIKFYLGHNFNDVDDKEKICTKQGIPVNNNKKIILTIIFLVYNIDLMIITLTKWNGYLLNIEFYTFFATLGVIWLRCGDLTHASFSGRLRPSWWLTFLYNVGHRFIVVINRNNFKSIKTVRVISTVLSDQNRINSK